MIGYPHHGGENQQWMTVGESSTMIMSKKTSDSGHANVLTFTGTRAEIWPIVEGDPQQRWNLTEI